MQLSPIITRINTNCTSVLQVLAADGIARDTIDTSLKVYTLLNAVFPSETYPITYPKESFTLPAAVYTLQASQKIDVSGVNILQRDVFVIYFQTEYTSSAGGFTQLVTLRESVRDGLLGYGSISEAIEIEIADEALDYLPDLDRYQCSMEIHITHLIGVVQSAPTVLVFEESARSNSSDFDSCIIQNKQTTISLIIVCNVASLETVRASLEDELIGFQPGAGFDGMELLQEGRINTTGDLITWQQRYMTTHQVRQQ